MNNLASIDWQKETIRYDRPHPRLKLMARELASWPQRRLLDVGCSTAVMRTLLPSDFSYYGCDITDHAQRVLGEQRFRQIDFNLSTDLSAFDERRIDVVHVGGVFEYLQTPEDLMAEIRRLVGDGGRLVVSLINFESRRYARPTSHHVAWVYKPTLDAFRNQLAAEGWRIDREQAFLGKGPIRELLFRAVVNRLGVNHGWVRQQAQQFVLTAHAA